MTSMVTYVYGSPVSTWEIWECGEQAMLYDGKDPQMLERLIKGKWSQVHTFEAAGEEPALKLFKHWVEEQIPPIGSHERVRLYLADLQVEAVH